MDHSHHPHSNSDILRNTEQGLKKENHVKLALSATLHCLIGCGLGEVLGMIIGTRLHMTNTSTTIIAIILGFVLGFAFGMVPLIRAGFPFNRAFKQVLIAEGLSIAVMETFEVLVQVYTPGVMDAHLSDWLFWKGMLFGLIAGFIAAFPVNYFFVKKGIRHQH
jgi:putative flippase GtrA